MSAADGQAYAIATDPMLEGQTDPTEASVLLAPDLNGILNRATRLCAQVGTWSSRGVSCSATVCATARERRTRRWFRARSWSRTNGFTSYSSGSEEQACRTIE